MIVVFVFKIIIKKLIIIIIIKTYIAQLSMAHDQMRFKKKD